MSRLISLLLMSMLLFPLAGLMYVIVFVVFVEARGWGRNREETGFVAAGIVIWIFMSLYWASLWRKQINWTPKRIQQTLLCFAAAAIIGLVLGFMTANVEKSFGCFVGSVSAPLLWLVGTIFVWRESSEERAARLGRSGAGGVVCPTCGYNLTGLTGTRCPECGSEFTLDQLLASQPGKDQVEIEA